MSYLYGCSVQGIQKFIFESTRLKEIAGASELVEEVCSTFFQAFVESQNVKARMLIQAAGNIRAVFADRAQLEPIYRLFPKYAAEQVPGLSLVQTVVEFQEPLCAEHVAMLSEKLQGRIAEPPIEVTSSVTLRAPRTGRGAIRRSKVDSDGSELQDATTVAKLDAEPRKVLRKKFDVTGDFPTDLSDIADCGNYIAVIHADGNALGKKLASLSAVTNYEKQWRDFSEQLGKATQQAACKTYQSCFPPTGKNMFRPVLLGGDDLTVICCASRAIDFTQLYLKAFETECNARPLLHGLTACAGIAFIKSSFPFYYGVELAEKLCSAAKKRAKELDGSGRIPSCLMFMRNQSSFVEASYSAITSRTLQAGKTSLVFGPYAADKTAGLASLEALRAAVLSLRKFNSLRTGLRQIESELSLSSGSAKQMTDRLEVIARQKNKMELENFKQSLADLTGVPSSKTLWDQLVVSKCSPIADLLLYSNFITPEEEAK